MTFDSAVFCSEADVPKSPKYSAIAKNNYLELKENDNVYWNSYGRILTYTCPEGHVVDLPQNDTEQTLNNTQFLVRCDADARWRPMMDHIKMPDVPVIPACIRKLFFLNGSEFISLMCSNKLYSATNRNSSK